MKRFFADAAGGNVDDAFEADAIVRVVDQAQIGQYVLDLAPLVEAHPTHQDIGRRLADKGLFHRARLRVGAVHHGKIFIVQTVLHPQQLDLFQDIVSLVALVVGLENFDTASSALVGMQSLGRTIAIVVDDRAGGIKNILRAAVVLLKQDHSWIGVVFAEAQDIAIVRASEGINRLIFVADNKDIVLWRGEDLHQFVLHFVGILKFIDQHSFEARLILVTQPIAAAQ